MARLFDPVSFMNETVPANATKRIPRPVGEPVGIVTALDWKSGQVKKPGPSLGSDWFRLDVKLEVTDPEYIAQCVGNQSGKELFTYGIMYDAQDDGRPKIGENVNVALGKFRDACNANGKPYAMCIGQPLKLQVIQKPHPTNPNDPPLDEVYSVSRP